MYIRVCEKLCVVCDVNVSPRCDRCYQEAHVSRLHPDVLEVLEVLEAQEARGGR